MHILWQDLRYGARVLTQKPSFTLIAVFTLALGIGANTAIFSVVNAVLLRPLAYNEPENIVTVLDEDSRPISPANFLDIRENTTSFEQMAAAEFWSGTLGGNDRPEIVSGLRMSDGMTSLLGVAPLLGRTFQTDEYQPGQDRVLLLSHGLWQRLLGGDEQVVGRSVTVSGESYTVIGVMPPDFQFPPFWATRAEMWAPLDLTSRAANRWASSLRGFARLKHGFAIEQSQAEVDALSAQLAASYPEANTGLNLRVEPLNEKVVGNVRPALLMLLAAVGLVLLIACANVACLLLARASARRRETAVRIALGATRQRIIRQLLTESLLLSLGGGLVGVLLAVWGVEILTQLLAGNASSFSARLPRAGAIEVDGIVLAFTFSVSMVTGVLFGLGPAISASKSDLNQTLREGSHGTSEGRSRFRQSLVVAELALALVLLIGTGLLINSFSKLQSVDPGFDPDNALALTVSLDGMPQYVGPSREMFYRQLTDQLLAVPGVEVVGAINHLPLAGDEWGTKVVIEELPLPPPGQEIRAIFRVTRPDYFRAMGIRFNSGRDFTERDAPDAPGVVIINETFARRYWPSEDALGKRITLDDPRDGTREPIWLTVVGVVADVKQHSWTEEPSVEVYLPFQRSRGFYVSTNRIFTSMTLVVRTGVDPSSLSPTLQAAIRSFDRGVPVSDVISLSQVTADAVWQQRFNLQLASALAGIALLLAVVGVYGVMSYSVARRTRELGIRLTLGAEARDVQKLVLGEGLKLVLPGIGLGLLAAAAVTRLMTSVLFEVSPSDPLTFLSLASVMTVVALLACWIPARRAAKLDPMAVLRNE